MSSIVNYPHLTVDADGAARIGATRYKIVHLAAEHYHYGWTAEELMRQHPDLRPEEVYSALTYFYDHHDELVAEMQAVATEIDSLRRRQKLSRAELLARKKEPA
jgi:uncharacterized protein (DUF433 family)